MRAQRILFGILTPSLGGHTRTALALAEVLRERGYSVDFLVARSAESGTGGNIPDKASLITAAGFPVVTIESVHARFWSSSFRRDLGALVRRVPYDVLHWFELTGLRAAALVAAQEGRGFIWSHTSGGAPPGYYGLNRVVVFTQEVADDVKRRSPRTAMHVLPARLDLRSLDRQFVDNARLDVRGRHGIRDDELLVVRVARCSSVYLRTIRLGLDLARRLTRAGQPAVFLHAGYLEDPEIAREIRRLVDEANAGSARPVAHTLTQDLEAGTRYIAAGDVCIASGRSALEALALERLTLVAWGSRYLGIVDEENIRAFADTNFQGRDSTIIGSDDDIVIEMLELVRSRLAQRDHGAGTHAACARFVRERYSVEGAADFYEQLYADRTVRVDGFLKHYINPRHLGRELFHRLPSGIRFSRPANFLRRTRLWPGLPRTD